MKAAQTNIKESERDAERVNSLQEKDLLKEMNSIQTLASFTTYARDLLKISTFNIISSLNLQKMCCFVICVLIKILKQIGI